MGNMKYYETNLDLVEDNRVLPSDNISRQNTPLVELTSQENEVVHHKEEMVFENSRQELKHYILMGKKLYVRKDGTVCADKPESQDLAIIIGPGKFAIGGDSSPFEKPKHFLANHDCNQELTEDEETIFWYVLICLGKEFDSQEIQMSLSKIEEFECRFPEIAAILCENDDSNKECLKRTIIKHLLFLGFKVKANRSNSCSNEINIDGKDVVIPKGKINPPAGLPFVAPTEEEIMNRRNSLMHKLLAKDKTLFDDDKIKSTIVDLVKSNAKETKEKEPHSKIIINEPNGQIEVSQPRSNDDIEVSNCFPKGKLAGENYTKADALSSDYQDNEFKAGTTGNRMQTIEEIFKQQRREKLKQERGLLRHLKYDQESDNSLIKINVDVKKEEDKTIFKYALICLRKGFNYDELKSVFSHISEFEKRFPYVADKFHKNVDDNAILKLRAELLKAVLLLGGKIQKSKRPDEDKDVGTITIPKGGLMSIGSEEDCKSNDSDNKSDCAYVVDEMDSVLFSDNRIRNTINAIINNPSPIQSNSSIIDEDNLKEKRERLKEKLLSGEYINLKPKSDITDSDSLLRIPGGIKL